ncbi:hypothetical protein [Streptomyces sp. NPDC058989]|uniref:hypothetical protein n=1 Tax=Streptomyces sp. NPDC058989 TaxID=3346686 RepID=UPI0036AF7742
MPAHLGPAEYDRYPQPLATEVSGYAPVPPQRSEGTAGYGATPPADTSRAILAETFTSLAADCITAAERLWTVTLATEAGDGRAGIHHFVIETRHAKDAISMAIEEALTKEARAHRRDAAIRPGSVVVSLWPDE